MVSYGKYFRADSVLDKMSLTGCQGQKLMEIFGALRSSEEEAGLGEPVMYSNTSLDLFGRPPLRWTWT